MISLDNIEALGVRSGLFQPKRCIVVDAGGSSAKVLLAERSGRRVTVLHALTLNLEEEGLINAEEIRRHMGKVLDDLGDASLILVIRQSTTISQIMDLGKKWPYNVKRAIREETRNLSGLTEKSILYDFVPMRPFSRFQAPFWVTIARENEVSEQLELLEGSGRKIAGVMTPANSLINAFERLCPDDKHGLLVDIGETSTTVALVEDGQGIFATNIALGSEHFTEAIAEDEGCSYDRASALKQETDLFSAEKRYSGLLQVLARWRREIDDVVLEWSREQGVELDRYRHLPCWLSGGGSRQPGIQEYLAREWRGEMREWPLLSSNVGAIDSSDYMIGFGAVLGAFRKAAYSVNLLPHSLRRARAFERQVRLSYGVGCVVLLLLAVLMGREIFALTEDIALKREEIEYREHVWSLAESIDGLREERLRAYREALPIFFYKKRTRDLLETLAFAGEISDPDRYWFVLLSDQRSYFEGHPVEAGPREGQRGASVALDDILGDQTGFVIELCIPVPDENESDAQVALADVVSGLRGAPFLWSVDKLPAGQRRYLVEDEATIQEDTYSLTLELEPFRHSLAEAPSLEWTRTPRFLTRP